ncbi:MAG TPA: chemotaxis response regulator protein-glutamate methylesterase [Clostridia bacterium]|nr:chemotaxis response regulator protein-glutamate methylesterase [Clostridia bacterium]
MSKIRVLAVDDSAVMRRLLREMLTADPDLEVAGVAANGAIALSLIEQLRPDLVTLDVEMPEMDGITALRHIRSRHPALPVIMFSPRCERGAEATVDALALGASDYVTKPSAANGLAAAALRVEQQLIPKIKALVPERGSSVRRRAVPVLRQVCTGPQYPVEIVAIGSSTGGPNALATVLSSIPADFPVPIVIVQHMPPDFTGLLAKRLDSVTAIAVEEATAQATLAAGHAYVAPGDYHMTIHRNGMGARVKLMQSPPENSCRPSVDVLFRSVARDYGSGVLGVVMTGMGQDGLLGCEAIKAAGGQVIVQDEATSVVWGMPGFVARAGLADEVLALPEIAGRIVRRVVSKPAAARAGAQ